MSRYSEDSYTPEAAFRNIGASFWESYEGDLLAFAIDRSKTYIPKRIHVEWDGSGRSAYGTDIRIEWALALYDHGDWPGCEKPAAEGATEPPGQDSREAKQGNIEKKCSNCFHSKNPNSCGHGLLGPCEDWREATEPEGHWPTWDDMKRAQYGDLMSRYSS